MRPALVIGAHNDEHVLAVLAQLAHKPLVLDVETLSDWRFTLGEGRLELSSSTASHLLDVDRPVRGWLRRVTPQHWHSGIVAESREFAEMSSWLSLTSSILRDNFANWLTPLDASVRADNKLVVQQAARHVGIRMPWTVVTNDPTSIPADPDDTVVVKPLGPGHFVESGRAYNVFATAVDMKSLTPTLLGRAPFLVQEHLRAVRHRRVVTVGNAAWSAVLEAHAIPLDWRSEPMAHRSFRPEHAPADVATDATRIAQHLELGYSSQDWLETAAGEHVLLDINPAGQWLFLPPPVADPVTAAIAHWLDFES